ncbi:hypothetical protein BDP27DRAFT_1460941 [Rhodocollybia butyracea]|uniref:Uncharacterized protein n=1 Tax=Rhodocollybia butyracea TaxID=206335 RepID=A0A9P5Q456_9AGAR|nr:hypothetical protein BDP27DRAFT_1460941 [Rhodocollybia butyracea]
MPGPKPGYYIITALRGDGGTVGVPIPTDTSKPLPQAEPIAIVPNDPRQRWEVFRTPQGGTCISPLSSVYLYSGAQDDNLVIATNNPAQNTEWEFMNFDRGNERPDVYAIFQRRGNWKAWAWTLDPEQDPETQHASCCKNSEFSHITVEDLELLPTSPPLGTDPQLFHFRRVD